jgi:ribosomal protein S18 acetylase RimI-like enzyme
MTDSETVAPAFVTRAYTDADAPAVVELMNERETAFGGDPYFTVAQIREMAADWAHDIATDSRLAFTPDGRLVGLAVVVPPPDGGTFGDTFAGVRMDFQGRGVGRALVAWEFERLRELHAELAPESAWTINFGANIADDKSIRLFERIGLSPVRYFFEMLLPIGDVRPSAMPSGFRVEPYSPDVAERLYEADDEAFTDHWGHERMPIDKWRALTVDSELFRPDLTRIAFDGDEIAAYVLSYDDGIGSHYIGQVGTRRPWRRRGLAAALMSETIEAAAAGGKTLATLGVDADNPTGALGVYERLGFAPRQRWVVYRAPLD